MVSSDQWAVVSGEKKKRCKSERSERAWMLSQNHAEWQHASINSSSE